MSAAPDQSLIERRSAPSSDVFHHRKAPPSVIPMNAPAPDRISGRRNTATSASAATQPSEADQERLPGLVALRLPAADEAVIQAAKALHDRHIATVTASDGLRQVGTGPKAG